MTEGNVFLDSLTAEFADVLDHAIAQKYIVCVPNPSSLADTDITRRFVSNL